MTWDESAGVFRCSRLTILVTRSIHVLPVVAMDGSQRANRPVLPSVLRPAGEGTGQIAIERLRESLD